MPRVTLNKSYTGANLQRPFSSILTLGKSFTLVDGANIAVDASLGNIATVVLNGNRIIDNPTNPTDWQPLIFILEQGAGAPYTVTFDTDYIFGDTLPVPVLSTVAGDKDYLGFIYNPDVSEWHYLAEAFGLA